MKGKQKIELSNRRTPASQQYQRGAGILLHITSLPSRYGIGDLGPEAKSFARFLNRSGQRYWQVLPLNPITSKQHHSPYSATSAFAGNTLLISPDVLVEDGYLKRNDLKYLYLPSLENVDFAKAKQIKISLLEKAYYNFCQGRFTVQKRLFQKFCKHEAHWLDDFAIYQVLSQKFENKEWHEWPVSYKRRTPFVLQQTILRNQTAVQLVKWVQFIFFQQWNELKTFCNKLNIKLIGDLPFYVCYDSIDVWSNPEIFDLDEQRNMKTVSGVPPDLFNLDGQRWGTPTFNWNVLAKNNFEWWIKRIRKNIEMLDMLRLDHFRAFEEYYEIPARDKTARNGIWKKGPSAKLFKILQDQFYHLPFVAEDLGDIDDPVRQLRDEFALPGMKVLQFAFDGNMPSSEHIPHNYESPNFFVYTGTHDNNTTQGWYENEVTKKASRAITSYLGDDVTKENIHYKLSELAYTSICKTVILPMQDVLGTDKNTRMNTPATTNGNWLWRLTPGLLSNSIEKRLLHWVKLYNREERIEKSQNKV